MGLYELFACWHIASIVISMASCICVTCLGAGRLQASWILVGTIMIRPRIIHLYSSRGPARKGFSGHCPLYTAHRHWDNAPLLQDIFGSRLYMIWAVSQARSCKHERIFGTGYAAHKQPEILENGADSTVYGAYAILSSSWKAFADLNCNYAQNDAPERSMRCVTAIPNMYTFLRLALLALRVSALKPHLRPRADPSTAEDISNALAPTDDGPTSDNTAGIGAEFESSMFVFTSDCSPDNTFPSKGKIIDGRSGTNWELTADTTLGAGRLTAEYILDGRQIKTSWFASGLECGTQVEVQGSACNPWTVKSISSIASLYWSVQITAPMPLEAVYYLFKQQYLNDASVPRNILNGNARSARTSLVTKGHFTTNSNGIVAADVTDDVLAFCTLVMSYAKAALTGGAADSPKTYTTFMPRTEFNTMFAQVQAKLPGDLFNLFNSLACFTATDDVDLEGNPGWE
nr:hypothetical protein CFP56_36351 [Quercus suber]